MADRKRKHVVLSIESKLSVICTYMYIYMYKYCMCALVQCCNYDVMVFCVYEHFNYMNRGGSQGVLISECPL
jgi:hypothetical protein